MRPQFDADMSANMVMMMRADVDGAIWIIDDDDEGRFYEGAAHERGRVVPAFGGAAAVLDVVLARGLQGVVGVTRRSHPEHGHLPLFRPDLGDVASLLLIARGADRVLGEVGGAAWLTACGREIGGILPRAIHIARVLERIFGDAIGDDGWDQIMDWTSADVDWDVLKVAPERIAAAKQVESAARLEMGLADCDGMNAVRVLAGATRHYRPRGIPAYRGVTAQELLSLLRTGFDFEELEKDGVYWRLKQWQWANRRYVLFRQWRKLEPFGLLLDHRYLENDARYLAGSGLRFAILQLDLDHFKNVNDQLGHLEGDEAIRIAERTLSAVVAGRGEAYRRGGDELVALIVGLSRSDAEELGERLRQQVEATFREWAAARGLNPAPTASIGVVHVERACQHTEVLNCVESAQLTAKRSGKNRVVCSGLAEIGP